MSFKSDCIECGVCPDCCEPVDTRADVACPRCHALRTAEIKAREARGELVGGMSSLNEDKIGRGGGSIPFADYVKNQPHESIQRRHGRDAEDDSPSQQVAIRAMEDQP